MKEVGRGGRCVNGVERRKKNDAEVGCVIGVEGGEGQGRDFNVYSYRK